MSRNSILYKFWNSPTITTWLSFSIKSLPFILVIPMMLSRLDAATINVWNLFFSIITIINLVDVGFGVTFIRGFAYANSGVGNFTDNSNKSDWQTLKASPDQIVEELWGTMNFIYKILFFLQILLLTTAGTYLLLKPISLSLNYKECWYAWAVIILTSGFSLFSRKNINLLLGYNYVAQQKRIDAIINFSFLLVAIVVFYFTNSIFYFILISQSFHIVNYFVLKKIVKNYTLNINHNAKFSKRVFSQIWPSAWKSLLGVLFSSGLTQFTSLIYAQYATAPESAIYGIYLRVVTGISSFSQAPFYSKIPELSTLRAKNKLLKFYKKAKIYILRSHVVFIVGVFIFEFLGIPFFNLVGKEIQLTNSYLFYVVVLAFFFERLGAMHIQLVSTTNKIVWHIANGLNGMFIVIFILIFKELLDVIVFPAALLVGNLFIYAPIASYYSYKLSKKNILRFEMETSIFPFLVLVTLVLFKFLN